MLTFEFTGVSGEMTVRERLTSGMVGKEVAIQLSSDWDDLTKTAVFIAGDICRAAPLTGSTLVIPADVLRYPYRKLLVGVCGTNSDGTLVIPTILAPGPFVECGADPTADQITLEIPVWQKLQDQIGNLALLDTTAKDNLVAAINELAASGAAGADGKDGIDGEDGFSIFYVDMSIGTTSTSAMNVNPTLVTTNGRTIQAGDFLLTKNGCLAKVTAVKSSAVEATFLLNLMGSTPVRGTDYWTEEDIGEIKAYVDEAILGGAW